MDHQGLLVCKEEMVKMVEMVKLVLRVYKERGDHMALLGCLACLDQKDTGDSRGFQEERVNKASVETRAPKEQ